LKGTQIGFSGTKQVENTDLYGQKQMKTIKDVAQLANVSTATVSHVLSGKRYVSDDLVERVNQAVSQLDYRPSGIAKSLKTNKTHTVGVIVSDIQNPYFAGVVTGIDTYCFKKGYGVILGESYESPKREAYTINLMMEKRVDGLIIAPVGENQKELDLLIKTNIPFLLVNRSFPGFDRLSVIVDNEEGAYKATSYLINLGHRLIGIVCGPKEYSTTKERFAGYCRALREAEIPLREELICFSRLDTNSAYHKTLLLLEKSPTAIFATNNIITIGSLLALKKRNRRIPEDISFVAFEFEESPIPFLVTPTLTHVSQPSNQVGLEAAKMILAHLKGKPYKKQLILETKIKMGESAGPPPLTVG
jgi:LacI family transcriptional regulator